MSVDSLAQVVTLAQRLAFEGSQCMSWGDVYAAVKAGSIEMDEIVLALGFVGVLLGATAWIGVELTRFAFGIVRAVIGPRKRAT